MKPKRSSTPIELQTFPRRWWPRRSWFLVAGLAASLLIVFMAWSPGVSEPSPSTPGEPRQVAGPPWRRGNPDGRFALTFHADLECPFCRAYYPVLKRWVAENPDIDLRWNHLPLADHDARYPDLTPTIEQCVASGRPDAVIQAQAAEAMKSGVTATPSLRLQDRRTGKTILLQGPVEGDALLSAMDMLASEEPAVAPITEMPADVLGDMPR
ncbi:DsbA family protein [Azoarcus taiwanensis]|uniref:Disulfide bond formation protein DsbA n=1 Tax=Azoarcus taiwanensis TaxID=666964 RepID=A0A972FCR5_9RHOO|nr:DsbA family protein [Azoarcus taiwanensis]NMG02897.1 disulfide bond formation protein DsbA [Azoarcus taiwanensis]